MGFPGTVVATRRFFGDLLFAGFAHVAGEGGYFDENSYGGFHFTNAGIVGPIRYTDNPATPGDESTFGCALKIGPGCPGEDVRSKAIALADSRVNFGRFDANNDGMVRAHELTIQLFGPAPPGSRFAVAAATSSACPLTADRNALGDRVRACMLVPGDGGAVSAMTIAHELTHVLQDARAWEAYGWNARLNNFFSLMSATIDGTRLNSRKSFHLDAYTKMRLGWLRPRVVSTATRGCVDLAAAELQDRRIPAPLRAVRPVPTSCTTRSAAPTSSSSSSTVGRWRLTSTEIPGSPTTGRDFRTTGWQSGGPESMGPATS